MPLELRKVAVFTEEVRTEAGRELDRPITKVAVAAVVENPFAGRYVEDLSPLFALGEEIAELVSGRAVEALAAPAESFGKAAIVGTDGELEHAAAMLHPRFGSPLRRAVGGGPALIPSTKKRGGPGTSIDVPLHFKDAAYVRSHFDAMEIRISDAPRPDELVVIAAVTDGGRPLPRVGGLSRDEAVGQDGLR